jgi:hypothetical protein
MDELDLIKIKELKIILWDKKLFKNIFQQFSLKLIKIKFFNDFNIQKLVISFQSFSNVTGKSRAQFVGSDSFVSFANKYHAQKPSSSPLSLPKMCLEIFSLFF